VEISERIASWRRARKLNMSDLARMLDITRAAVSLWESGKTKPSHRNIAKLADAFGISLPRFWGAPPPKSKKRRAA
jgi:transcriptional regulator with XRE-family HTH domain